MYRYCLECVMSGVFSDTVHEVGHLAVDSGVALDSALVGPGHHAAELLAAGQGTSGVALK